MSEAATHQVTQILARISEGDVQAAESLLPLVYEELRKLAHARMAKERADHTLEPTALVHEAYMRLIGSDGGQADKPWDGRAHFFGAAAIAMRRILVERARAAASLKRGGDRTRVQLSEEPVAVALAPDEMDMVALDNAMSKLKTHDARKHDVVMLRYFAGLTIEETALAMSLSPATIKNEWTFARAWLHREMAKEGSGVRS
ncbi:MAG: sigma-70 family RNA polymerase sigma factor [Planctomycetes bacterium]|nr:sigma-70 family RNA polymerase sigma factor [Planctomycetota bacterium]